MKKELNKYAFILIDVILINLAYVLSLYISKGEYDEQFEKLYDEILYSIRFR